MHGGGSGEGIPLPAEPQTLLEAALEVLNTADPVEKARLTAAAAERWLQGAISQPYGDLDALLPVPDRPARLSNVNLVPPNLMPKLGKGGSLQSRQAILHSLVHTESWAIDLSWDIIARFGRQEAMPTEFFTDFVKVAQDEARHFTVLAARLEELGSFYGAFPAHDGLWDSAMQTSGQLLARLAVEHCVHEARGLDVLPNTISRFRNGGDERTANLLETVVYPEEITHCATGVKWFRYLCTCRARGPGNAALGHGVVGSEQLLLEEEVQRAGHADGQTKRIEQDFQCLEKEKHGEEAVIQSFHATVRKYFRGPLKPPFNEEARKAAGFGPDWYEPLAVKEVKVHK